MAVKTVEQGDKKPPSSTSETRDVRKLEWYPASWTLTWIPHVAVDDMLLSLSALLKPKPLLHPAGHPLSAQQGFHQLETIPLLTALFTTLPLYPMQVLFPSNFLLSHLSCTFCSVRFHIQNLFFLHFDVSLSIYTLLMLKINTFRFHPTSNRPLWFIFLLLGTSEDGHFHELHIIARAAASALSHPQRKWLISLDSRMNPPPTPLEKTGWRLADANFTCQLSAPAGQQGRCDMVYWNKTAEQSSTRTHTCTVHTVGTFSAVQMLHPVSPRMQKV